MTRNKFLKETNITIDSYRRGDREKEPGLDTVVIIANYFGLSIDAMCNRSAFAKDTTKLTMSEAVPEFFLLAAALEIDISKIVSKNILFSQLISNYTRTQAVAEAAVKESLMSPEQAEAGVRQALEKMISDIADIPTGAEYRDIASDCAEMLDHS